MNNPNMTAEESRAIEVLTEKLDWIKSGYEIGLCFEAIARNRAFITIVEYEELNLICHGRACSMYTDFYKDIEQMKQAKGE